jgi:AhpC/TSA antioxidant enzyme
VLAALYPEYLQGFDVFGIIKETGIDDEGLIDFYRDYFTFPLYRDASYAFYQALGDRKVALLPMLVLNPLSMFAIACDAWHRITRKKIPGTSNKGEGLVQGGIIIFKGTTLEPVAMLEEQTGVDLPVLDIVKALDFTRQQQQQQQQHNEQTFINNKTTTLAVATAVTVANTATTAAATTTATTAASTHKNTNTDNDDTETSTSTTAIAE